MNTLFLVCGLTLTLFNPANSWSYIGEDDGPDKWGDSNPVCNGNRQSPVNINTETTIKDFDLGEFRFNAAYSDAEGASIVAANNGHSVNVYWENLPMVLTGGGLTDNYEFLQVHFHWGANDWRGSEHTINGDRFPLEMHMVHWAQKYSTVGEALNNPDGVAVLGFMFEISAEDNPNIEYILNSLPNILNKEDRAPVENFPISWLFRESIGPYYRYLGSLTTPACQEAVIWTVFEKTIPISSSQVAKFRTLLDVNGEALVDTYRPLQNLYNRYVRYSAALVEDTSSASSFVSSMVLVATTMLLKLL